jgi:hypothetical protein
MNAKPEAQDSRAKGMMLMSDSNNNTSTNNCKGCEFHELGGEDFADAGLQAASRGWRIFPCKANKEPLVNNWPQVATTDPAIITAWATRWPGAIWARALPAGVVVLDLDRKHGLNGVLEFERLQGCHPDKFVAPRVITGTGGIHVYTDGTGRDFKNSVSAIAPGIDTKTIGGYCIIPSGNGVYRWLTDPTVPMPPAPQWTEVALRKDETLTPLAEARPFAGWSPYGNSILVSAGTAIANAPNGQQRSTLNTRSLIVGHYVGGGLLEYEPTIEVLVGAGMQMQNFDKSDPWTEPKVRKVIINALRDGVKRPMDGEEPFRIMQEVHKRYDDNPQLHEEVIEFLTAVNAGDCEGGYQPGNDNEDKQAELKQVEEKPGPQPEEQGKAQEECTQHIQTEAQPRQPFPEQSKARSPEDGGHHSGAVEGGQTFNPTDPWPVLNPDAMHGLAGDVVRLIEPHTESDPVALLIQFIVCFGNAVDRIPHYLVEASRHYPNMFAVLVGQSSKSRKGTSAARIRDIMSYADAADDDWTRKCIESGLSSGEGVIWRIRDPIYKISKGQRVLEDEGVRDKRLLIDEHEYFQVLTVMNRSGNTLSRVIRDAWDRDVLQTMTKNSPARATLAHVSIVGHITEDELRQTLDHTSAMNGFANRFVFALVRRARVLPHGGGDLDASTKKDVVERLQYAMGQARQTGRVTMTPAAATEWEQVYPQLSHGHPGMWGAACGRAEAQTIRLALIYALMDSRNQIDLVHLKAALALWDYCEQSAKHIFGDLFGEKVVDTILLALRQAGPEGMTRTEIYNLFGRNQSSDTITRGLQKLAVTGKARQFSKRDSWGRSTEMWVAL